MRMALLSFVLIALANQAVAEETIAERYRRLVAEEQGRQREEIETRIKELNASFKDTAPADKKALAMEVKRLKFVLTQVNRNKPTLLLDVTKLSVGQLGFLRKVHVKD